jgi:ATP-dependent RNA helicase DeaD
MSKPKTIEVASRNEGTKNVDHHYYMVNARDKYKALRRICDVNPNIYGIVFCRTRRETADIADKLMQDGYNADAIHGELSQAQRDHVMSRFRQKKLQILVATDVAARGIDINDLSHVINYNLPDDNEVYVHRSGRTGRAGKKGVSIIIAHSREGRKLREIEKMIKRELIIQQVPKGDEICKIQLMTLIDKVVATEINQQINKYLPSIVEKLIHLDKEELIKHFVSTEFNRFLSFYKNAPDLNVSSNNKRDKNERKDRSNSRGERVGHAEKGHTRFFINLGKEKDLQTHNLIGLINEYTKNRNLPIGKIDIMRKFSFFEIPSEFESEVLRGLGNANWNGNRVNVEVSQAPSKQRSSRVDNQTRKRKKNNSFTDSNKRKKQNSSKSFDSKSKSKTSKKEDSRNYSTGSGNDVERSSFKGRFNAAAKRKRRS